MSDRAEVTACEIEAEPVRLRVDFSKPDGEWTMPALALGQGGLQSDPMIEPHIKELRQLRPRTIRLFLSEYYRIYPDHNTYDWTKLDRELQAVRATGARPVLALAMKPPVLYPEVNHLLVHPNNSRLGTSTRIRRKLMRRLSGQLTCEESLCGPSRLCELCV